MLPNLLMSHELNQYYASKQYPKISAGRRDGILTLAGDLSGKHILDIGCAGGVLGKILKDRFDCVVVGVDISTDSILSAKQVLDEAYVCDITETEGWPPQLSQRTFDVVIISEVLEHIFEPEQILRATRAWCRPDTKVIVTVPNILFWKNRLRILMGHFEYEERGLMDRGHIHFFSWSSFVEMILQCGFVIEKISHHVPTRGTSLLSEKFPGLFAQTFIADLRQR
jgi:2-polyprenyl-3-methyl-5-hydroxy-6-metoxy-1,4-benzoquinol methylase